MTNEDIILQDIADIKQEIQQLYIRYTERAKPSFYFSGFWKNNDYQNLKGVAKVLVYSKELQARVTNTIAATVEEKGNWETASPYIADCLWRVWNDLHVCMKEHMVPGFKSLAEEAAAENKDIEGELTLLDARVNKLCLEKILNDRHLLK